MAELLLIRHAQASFGTEDYDRLSSLGKAQSRLVGAALKDMGWVPDRVVSGTLRRQKETLRYMGFDATPEEHHGFDEYDFHDLLRVRFGGTIPDQVHRDRKIHFRSLRETLREWQGGGLADARETWEEFRTRVEAARSFATREGAERVLAVSSGGAIGQLTAACLNAPSEQMIALNLQIKNTALSRFIFTPRAFFLHEFNATPHFAPADKAQMMTYS